jgi:hypothetical protein
MGWIRAGSTPRYPQDEAGMLWEQSTQHEYAVACSHCGTFQPMSIVDNLDAERAIVVCRHCHRDMTEDRLNEGVWVATQPDAPWHGYQMNKLLSPRINLHNLAATWRGVQEGRATVTEVQEFYNSDAGVPYLPKGGHLGPDELAACADDDVVAPLFGERCTMGIDVGNRFHVVIQQLRTGRPHLLFADSVLYAERQPHDDPRESLDGLMRTYDVSCCVVDANPGPAREAQRLRQNLPGEEERCWRQATQPGDLSGIRARR